MIILIRSFAESETEEICFAFLSIFLPEDLQQELLVQLQ
jgi:hypothetical protein